MTVVPVTVVDSDPVAIQWQVDQPVTQQFSPIPRGLLVFSGTDAVAAKGAGDETNYNLSMVMPPGFVFLPRNGYNRFLSDDLTESWNSNAHGSYQRTNPLIQTNTHFQITSTGQFVVAATLAGRIWTPGAGAPKLLLRGADTLAIALADMTAGATSAGDIRYVWEFYVFDSDQVDKWGVNTPLPVIDHSSF